MTLPYIVLIRYECQQYSFKYAVHRLVTTTDLSFCFTGSLYVAIPSHCRPKERTFGDY